jgi:hypothetical protein
MNNQEQPDYKTLYENLLIEFNQLKEHLKKYTAPKRNKDYYHNNKEKIIKKVKENQATKKPDPDKIKEYNKKAYQKRKQKLQDIKKDTDTDNNNNINKDDINE